MYSNVLISICHTLEKSDSIIVDAVCVNDEIGAFSLFLVCSVGRKQQLPSGAYIAACVSVSVFDDLYLTDLESLFTSLSSYEYLTLDHRCVGLTLIQKITMSRRFFTR